MALALTILPDPHDLERLRDFIDVMSRRVARAELLPIMKSHLEPVAASERAFLSGGGHNKSGALSVGLKARAGGGDRPGTISVFIAPTATKKQLITKWGQGRPQQQRWARKLSQSPSKGKRAVFYGPIVHQGHRIVKRRADGTLYDTGKRTKPVPFAAAAAEAMGQRQADKMADALLTHITGF